jgi:hypothetical protein
MRSLLIHQMFAFSNDVFNGQYFSTIVNILAMVHFDGYDIW